MSSWILDEIIAEGKSKNRGKFWTLDFVNIDTFERCSTCIDTKMFNKGNWGRIIENEQYGMYSFNREDPRIYKPTATRSNKNGYMIDADSKPILELEAPQVACKTILLELYAER